MFDAKYRLREEKDKDCAPRETLDDMHRYRDAILYREGVKGIKHEVIGAYVLYPGRAKPKSLDYKEIIDRENIGAIELLPGEEGTASLKKFLKTVLNKHGDDEHLKEAIAPRGAVMQIASQTEKNVLVLIEKNPRVTRFQYDSGDGLSLRRNLPKDGSLPQSYKFVLCIIEGVESILYSVNRNEINLKKGEVVYYLTRDRKYEDLSIIFSNDGEAITLHNLKSFNSNE